MNTCPNRSLEINDSRFQTVKQYYENKGYSWPDSFYVFALTKYRKYAGKPVDWFPESGSDFGQLTTYIRHKMLKQQLKETESELTTDAIKDVYEKLRRYSPTVLRDRRNLLAKVFRDTVDDMQKKEPGMSRVELIKSQATDKYNGYQRIMGDIFESLRNQNTKEKLMEQYDRLYPDASEENRKAWEKEAEYIEKEYKEMYDLKDYFTSLVAAEIGDENGFSVENLGFEMQAKSTSNVVEEKYIEELIQKYRREEAEEQLDTEEESEEDFERDEEAEDTEEGSDSAVDNEENVKGDRYIDFRTKRLMATVTLEARRFIRNIEMLDGNGKKVLTDLHHPRMLDDHHVLIVLQRILTTSTPDSMMRDLESWATHYPWLTGLLRKLRDNERMQALIYTASKKAETTFIRTDFRDGQYEVRLANSRSQGYALAKEAGNNVSSGYGAHNAKSVYTENGMMKPKAEIEKSFKEFEALWDKWEPLLRWVSTVDGALVRVPKALKSAVEANRSENFSYLLDEDSSVAMKKLFLHHPELAQTIAEFLNGLGFVMTAKDVITLSQQRSSKKSMAYIIGKKRLEGNERGQNKLYQLMLGVLGAYRQAVKTAEKPNQPSIEFVNTSTAEYNDINKVLAFARYNEVEPRVVEQGKSLSAYNNVNLIHQTIDKLSNKSGLSERDYLEQLEKDYLQFEGYAFGTKDSPAIISQRLHKSEKEKALDEFLGYDAHGWLGWLMNASDAARSAMRVQTLSNFNHVEFEDMSDAQKYTNMILNFFGANRLARAADNINMANYEVNLAGDYANASYLISAPVYELNKVIDELTYEVLLEAQRIASIEARQGKDHPKLTVYEDRGRYFQIFPSMNKTFRAEFVTKYPGAENNSEVFKFVREEVKKQLTAEVSADLKAISKSKVLANPAMKSVNLFEKYDSLYTENGQVKDLSKDQKDLLILMSANNIFAKQQMAKLLTGGMEHFKGQVDYRKRNMMTHSPHTSLYTNVKIDGKPKTHQNVLYIEDPKAESVFIDSIMESLSFLSKNKLLDKEAVAEMRSYYENIKPTDGNGFRTLDSWREIRIFSGEWTNEDEASYKRIKAGSPTREDVNRFLYGIKPVYTGYESVPTVEGQKPVRVPVFHKYSEAVLLPLELAKYSAKAKTVPMRAFAKLNEMLGATDKIDLFLFNSNVKVGLHSAVQPFAKNKKDSQYILKSSDDMAQYMKNYIDQNSSAVHRLDYSGFGIAMSTKPHFGRINSVTQMERMCWSNITDEDMITVRGKSMSAAEARDKFYTIKTAEIIEQFDELRELFRHPDELAKLFREELADKPYASTDLRYALARLENGEFAYPLFGPNVSHEVQALLASILKKRLSKNSSKGANLLQTTGFGIDKDSSDFDYEANMTESDKLKMHFDDKRGFYYDAIVPIDAVHPSLRQFADASGNISHELLEKLVATHVIPEEALFFVSCRTPSDATHSLMSCKIHSLSSGLEGGGVVMPREAMVTTGFDYDGDKLRCYFNRISVELIDKEEIYLEYGRRREAGEINSDMSFGKFLRKYVFGNRPDKYQFYKVNYNPYDYSKSPFENTKEQRDNARVELMQSYLSSEKGSALSLIPGETESTLRASRIMDIIRSSRTKEVATAFLESVADEHIVGSSILTNDQAVSLLEDSSSMYQYLSEMSTDSLTKLHEAINGAGSPFSMRQAVAAYDAVIPQKKMIGIYAMYNSAFANLQRANLNYVPYVYRAKDGKRTTYNFTLFGKTFGKLFNIVNNTDGSNSLGVTALSKLLQAAVDNPKNPILGYLNQQPEFAAVTFLMIAAGISEEELHLFFNQPAVIELAKRLKDQNNDGINREIQYLVDELSDNIDDKSYGPLAALKRLAKLEKDRYTDTLADAYNDILYGTDKEKIDTQVYVLRGLSHLLAPAKQLESLVKLTRPDSDSGSIGIDIADLLVKQHRLKKFREASMAGGLRISGDVNSIIGKNDIDPFASKESLLETFNGKIQEVSALNALLIDNTSSFLEYFFPTAKESWMEFASRVAGKYLTKSDRMEGNEESENLNKKTVRSIFNEMILWKLLSDKKFVAGNTQEEQARIIKNTPKYVSKLVSRIHDAQKNPGKYDDWFKRLIGNTFLMNLSSSEIASNRDISRLRFNLNGIAAEHSSESIRASWNEMLLHNESVDPSDQNSPTIKELATDLFLYNLYTNGFGYGMYEFSHFAPFPVLLETPGYIEALNRIKETNWDYESDDAQQFINYHYMNHWDDNRLVRRVPIDRLNDATFNKGVISIPATFENAIMFSDPYYVFLSGEGLKTKTFYRTGIRENKIVFEPAQRLGYKNKRGQVLLQMHPSVDYREVVPVINGDVYARQSVSEDEAYGNVDVSKLNEATSNRPTVSSEGREQLIKKYLKEAINMGKKIRPTSQSIDRLEQAAEQASWKNENFVDATEQFEEEAEQNKPESSITSKYPQVIEFKHEWSRNKVRSDTASLYIFTDNTDRDSGKTRIDPASRYAKKYGTDKHFPTMTQAVIRGLDNAYPISTQHWYHYGATGVNGRWNDADLEEFKKTIDAEVEDIVAAWESGNYRRIVIGSFDGFFNSKISNISEERTPALYQYLNQKLEELFERTKPEDIEEITNNEEVAEQPAADSFEDDGFGQMSEVDDDADEIPDSVRQLLAENGFKQYMQLASIDENGKIKTRKVPATPRNIWEARKQKVFVELNKRLKSIFTSKGVSVGVLTDTEARLAINGVSEFETAPVFAEGFKMMVIDGERSTGRASVRVREGFLGEMALPEEFAHTAVEMLGHDHPLIQRLYNLLSDNEQYLSEVYGEDFERYKEEYEEDKDKLIIEAIGKLIAKQWFYQQESKTAPVRSLLRRIIDWFKRNILNKFSSNELQDAINEANSIASGIASGILNGKILDDMSLQNISTSASFLAAASTSRRKASDLSNKKDVMSELLKIKVQQRNILKIRILNRTNKQTAQQELQRVEDDIAMLEAGIRMNQVDTAIHTYIENALEELKAAEAELDATLAAGLPANRVCKALVMTRDTLYSFATALKVIEDAIEDGQLVDSDTLRHSRHDLTAVLNDFYRKYNRAGMYELESMLTDVYGPDGVKVNIGKEKGRVISIREMARKADSDISWISHMVDCLSDCNDFILKAVDYKVKTAKQQARKASEDIRRDIEVAIGKLHDATGSYDQDFMFAYKVDNTGKKVRTGEYIKDSEARQLGKAKYDFYKEMMRIKRAMDKYMPEDMVSPYKMVMVRKLTMERYKSAEGAKGKALVMYESLKNRIMESEDSFDPDTYKVQVDFEGNRVDRLPIKFLNKGKSESYDDMTTDVATSLAAYASMANEYHEMNKIIGILENAKYMSSERQITQKTGRRTMRQVVGNPDFDDYVFTKDFTVKQARSRIQQAFADYMMMHVYGHIRKDEGTFGNTRISKRKTADALIGMTSMAQMALNIPQRIINIATGETQIIIEAGKNGEFSGKDVAWATNVYRKHIGDRLADTGKTESNDMVSLWAEKFNVHQTSGRNLPNYKKGRLSRIFNTSLLYAGLTMGEDFLAITTSLALAKNFKVKSPSNKVESLFDAYKIEYKDEANERGAYLKLKDGYTKLDGSAITAKDEDAFELKVLEMNHKLQGVYNLDDKSAMQQYILGSLIIMYRKWIAPSLKRRYAKTQYNRLTDKYTEGYYRTFFRTVWDSMLDAKDAVTEDKSAWALLNIIEDIKAFSASLAINKQNLDPYEMSNMRKATKELLILAGLFLTTALLGSFGPGGDDDKNPRELTWWEKQVYVNALRIRSELGSMAPTPMMLNEGLRILGSPTAAIKPLRATINGLQLLLPWNYFSEIKSGKYKGHSKSYKYFMELPPIAMFSHFDNFIDPSSQINWYKNENVR